MPSVQDIVITIINEEPGPTVTDIPAAAIDITAPEGLLNPAVVEIQAEMQMQMTVNSALDPEFVEIERPGDVSTITVPQPGIPELIEVLVPGVQGAPGVQNVFVQETPPANPEINWIWIDPTT